MMFLRIYGKIQKGPYPRIQSLMEKGDLHLVSNNTTQHVIGNGQKEVKPFPFDDDIISQCGGRAPEKFFCCPFGTRLIIQRATEGFIHKISFVGVEKHQLIRPFFSRRATSYAP